MRNCWQVLLTVFFVFPLTLAAESMADRDFLISMIPGTNQTDPAFRPDVQGNYHAEQFWTASEIFSAFCLI